MNLKLIAAGSAVALALCGAGAAAAGSQAAGEAPGTAFDAALSYLHIDKVTLAKDLRSGQTLAQIADAQGKTTGGLVDAVVAATQAQLDAAVTAGKLSSAAEQALLAKYGTSVSTLVTKRFAGAVQLGTQRPRPVTLFLQPLLARLQLRLQTLPTKIVNGRIPVSHGKTSLAGSGSS